MRSTESNRLETNINAKTLLFLSNGSSVVAVNSKFNFVIKINRIQYVYMQYIYLIHNINATTCLYFRSLVNRFLFLSLISGKIDKPYYMRRTTNTIYICIYILYTVNCRACVTSFWKLNEPSGFLLISFLFIFFLDFHPCVIHCEHNEW